MFFRYKISSISRMKHHLIISLSENKIKAISCFQIEYGFVGDTMKTEMLKFERIRNLREDRDLTQQKVADYLHVKQNTYSQYEIGVLNYPVEVLI